MTAAFPTSERAVGREIEIVIPHVDGLAPNYETSYRRVTGGFVPCHVRDLGELRYVLRSIDRLAPWARRVTLVVQDEAHLPSWLERSQVRVVRHDEFLPPEVLPTFHWPTIAGHLHRIPGLAERYVVWEDDQFLVRQVAGEDLFRPDGNPRLDHQIAPVIPGVERLIPGDLYALNLRRTRDLLARACGGRRGRVPVSCYVYPHMPLPVARRGWEAMFSELWVDPVFRDTVTRTHRGDERARPTIDPLVLYANWVEVVERERAPLDRLLGFLRQAWGRLAVSLAPRSWRRRLPFVFGSYPLYNDPARTARSMDRLLAERPTFANVNDCAYDGWRDAAGVEWSRQYLPSPASLARLQSALEALHPDRCRFERVASA